MGMEHKTKNNQKNKNKNIQGRGARHGNKTKTGTKPKQKQKNYFRMNKKQNKKIKHRKTSINNGFKIVRCNY